MTFEWVPLGVDDVVDDSILAVERGGWLLLSSCTSMGSSS